jgi:hypothetical protein
MIIATDQPRTQHLRQEPSLHLQTEGTLLAQKPPPRGRCNSLFPQDLMEPVNRRLCHIRLHRTRDDLTTACPVTLVTNDHRSPPASVAEVDAQPRAAPSRPTPRTSASGPPKR